MDSETQTLLPNSTPSKNTRMEEIKRHQLRSKLLFYLLAISSLLCIFLLYYMFTDSYILLLLLFNIIDIVSYFILLYTHENKYIYRNTNRDVEIYLTIAILLSCLLLIFPIAIFDIIICVLNFTFINNDTNYTHGSANTNTTLFLLLFILIYNFIFAYIIIFKYNPKYESSKADTNTTVVIQMLHTMLLHIVYNAFRYSNYFIFTISLIFNNNNTNNNNNNVYLYRYNALEFIIALVAMIYSCRQLYSVIKSWQVILNDTNDKNKKIIENNEVDLYSDNNDTDINVTADPLLSI